MPPKVECECGGLAEPWSSRLGRRFDVDEIVDADDWHTCSVGERLGFPTRTDDSLIAAAVYHIGGELYRLAGDFTFAVSYGNNARALEIHDRIQSEEFDMQVEQIRGFVADAKLHGALEAARMRNDTVKPGRSDADNLEAVRDSIRTRERHIELLETITDKTGFDLKRIEILRGALEADRDAEASLLAEAGS